MPREGVSAAPQGAPVAPQVPSLLALPAAPPPLPCQALRMTSRALDAARAHAALWEALGADGSIGAEALDLSRNELEALPDALLAPPPSRNPFAGLVCLDVSRNRLTELPAALATAAPALIDVRAAANHLRPAARALSPALRAALLPRLRLFDLRFNPKLHRGAPQDDGGGASVPARAGGWLEAELREWMTRPGALLLLTPPERRRGGTRTGGVDGIISGACDLRAQLSPLSTPTLRRRLEAEFGVHTDPECTGRDGVLEALLDAYERVGGRTQLRMEDAGVPLPPAVARELLQALRETAWGSLRNEREKVSSTGGYVLLRRGDGSASASNAQRRALAKRRRHARVWDAAHAALRCADASFAEQYDTIALTYGFTGSPHIDRCVM